MKSILTSLILLVSLLGQAQKSKKDYLFQLKTSFGNMTVLLYDETPLHKANFIKLAKSGRYDSTYFHRVIDEFVIQGGDIYRKPNEQRGKEDDRIPSEIMEGLFHKKGELAAARTNNSQKKSSSCQFYIVHGKVHSKEELSADQNKLNSVFAKLMMAGKIDSLRQQLMILQKEHKIDEMNTMISNSKSYLEELSGEDLSTKMPSKMIEAYSTIGGTPLLDGEYTVFGRVVEGMEVIDKIAAVETKPGDEPVERVYMTVEVIKMKKKKITKLYGYTFPEK